MARVVAYRYAVNTRVPRVRALTTISDRWLCQRVGQHIQQQMLDDLL
jgi:hypothetical protein